MNDQMVVQELEKLRMENQLLKQLISDLPFTFTYNNAQFGYKVTKTKENGDPFFEQEHNTNIRNEFIITSRFEEFEELETLLSPILDTVPHHIVFVDQNGIITLCNLQVAKDFEVDRDEMIGKHIRELLHLPDEKILALESIRTGKEIFDKEVFDTNYGILNNRILKNPDGTIKRVISTFYFLNRIKEAEKQAVAGRIAAGIAHEIRNPLTTVRGYLQHLEKNVDEGTSHLFSKLLIPEIDRANKIISDFLSIAKPSHPKTETIHIQHFLMDYLWKFLKSESFLYNAEIDLDIHPTTKHLYILCDREELLQVFMNLFINSMQAIGKYPLKINIRTNLVESYVQIIFADNGKGIHPSILEHIFDPFFSTKDDGTGLGLSVSRKIIENHGGKMYASSNENGTKFTIELPITTNTKETTEKRT